MDTDLSKHDIVDLEIDNDELSMYRALFVRE